MHTHASNHKLPSNLHHFKTQMSLSFFPPPFIFALMLKIVHGKFATHALYFTPSLIDYSVYLQVQI